MLDKEAAEKLAAVQAEQRGKQPAAPEEKQQPQPQQQQQQQQQQQKTRGQAAGSPAPADRKPAAKPATKPAAPAAEQPAATAAARAGAAGPSTGKGMVGKRMRVWLEELGEWKEGKSTSYTKR